MSWVKLDDQFFTHPKAVAAGKDGRALYLAALCWAKAHLTDGLIPKGVLPMLAAQAEVVGRRTATTLVGARLWHDEGDHWRIHGYHERNDPAEDERARKEQHAEKMRQWREAKKAKRDAKRDPSRDESQRHVTGSQRDASRDAVVTSPDTDTDTDTDRDIEISSSSRVVVPLDRRGGEAAS